MRSYALTGELVGRTLALDERRAELYRHLLAQGADDMMLFGQPTERADTVALQVVAGVAVIPVRGVLMPGDGGGWWWSLATFYGDIRSAFRAALASPDVTAIVLHVDSPGGTVQECFDTADMIFEARGTKPIVAILDEKAASAAYALASSADTVTIPRTGSIGSIGTIAMHIDISAALEQAGIRVSTLQFGARKADWSPTAPLSDEARTRVQAELDACGEIFVDLVARNRAMPPAKVRATEAAVFMGQAGVAAGLADAVMSSEAAFADLLLNLNR